MLGTILIVVLVLMLFGGLAGRGNWGYGPSGGIGLILLVVVLLLLFGRL